MIRLAAMNIPWLKILMANTRIGVCYVDDQGCNIAISSETLNELSQFINTNSDISKFLTQVILDPYHISELLTLAGNFRKLRFLIVYTSYDFDSNYFFIWKALLEQVKVGYRQVMK